MMDSKTKSRLISAARRCSRWHKPRVAVKKKAQIDKALFECELCSIYVYEGSSGSNYITMVNKYPGKKILREPGAVDHLEPVVDPKKGFESWDIYYDRMFCEEDNFQYICNVCHDKKTLQEKEIRTKYNKKRKDANNSKKRRRK